MTIHIKLDIFLACFPYSGRCPSSFIQLFCDCIKVDNSGGQFEQRKSQNWDAADKYLEKFRNVVTNIKRLKGVAKYFNFQGGI